MPKHSLEEWVAGLEGSYKELTKRVDDLREETYRGLNSLRAKVNGLRAGMNSDTAELRAAIRDLRTEFPGSFRWTMSLGLIDWLSRSAALMLVNG